MGKAHRLFPFESDYQLELGLACKKMNFPLVSSYWDVQFEDSDCIHTTCWKNPQVSILIQIKNITMLINNSDSASERQQIENNCTLTHQDEG